MQKFVFINVIPNNYIKVKVTLLYRLYFNYFCEINIAMTYLLVTLTDLTVT